MIGKLIILEKFRAIRTISYFAEIKKPVLFQLHLQIITSKYRGLYFGLKLIYPSPPPTPEILFYHFPCFYPFILILKKMD